MFIHHVFFWLKEGASKAAFLEGLEGLKRIDTIQQIFIGDAIPSPREVVEDTFDTSLLVFFNNKEDHDIYQDHPFHHEFVDSCSSLWEKVVVYDATG